jgi:hypothetical protein
VSEHLCVVCPVLRRGEPRIYERANVCEACRPTLRSLIVEAAQLYADITLERASTGGDRVSGSRTPPVPLNIDALDMTMPPHLGAVADELVKVYATVKVEVEVWLPAQPDVEYATVTEERSQRVRARDDRGILAYGPSGDQVGEISVPTMLETAARDWQTYRWALLPEPTVPALAKWLEVRLEWACDHHPAIDEFAAEIRDQVRTLRRLNGLAGPAFDTLDVPCRRCDWLTLAPIARKDLVECLHCGDLTTGEELDRWTGLLAAAVRDQWVDFDLDAMLYLDEAALLGKVTENTVRQWVKRGVLEVAERHHGRPLFVARDVLEAERRTRTGVVLAE